MSTTTRALTVAEAASALQVCRATVRAAIKDGRIKAIRFGRLYRIPASEIERYTRGEAR